MIFTKKFEKLVLKFRESGITKEVETYYSKVLNSDEKEKHKFLYDIFSVDEKLKIDFVKLNNLIVEKHIAQRDINSVMLLLPFCLQNTRCSHQIVWNIDNCTECGACKIGDLKKLSREKHMDIKVSIRSAFAPKFVRDANPDLVIALACENEAVKGILAVPEYPCYCIFINHPNGFCFNTTVGIDTVLESINKFSDLAIFK